MDRQRLILIVAVLLASGHVWLSGGFVGVGAWLENDRAATTEPARGARPGFEKATFAAGCFWSVESDFDKVRGVVATTAGYTGGRVPNPSYEQVSTGATGHVEAVELVFDPAVVSYEQLLDHYWHNVDLFVAHRQFCDVGNHYRPAIFAHDAGQRRAAERSKLRTQERFRDDLVLVAIEEANPFYAAEPYHQDFHLKNPWQYRYYRSGCGRDRRLGAIWDRSAERLGG
jgi:peptide-methionine (S)-S-oxide reductase